MGYIKKWISIEEDGVFLTFGVTGDDHLKLFHF